MEAESSDGTGPGTSSSTNQSETSKNITGFGKVLYSIQMQMDRPTVLDLEVIFEFKPFERCQENDPEYIHKFIRSLKDKELISLESISPLTEALQKMGKKAAAKAITASFDEVVRYGKALRKQTVDEEDQQETLLDESLDSNETSVSSLKRNRQEETEGDPNKRKMTDTDHLEEVLSDREEEDTPSEGSEVSIEGAETENSDHRKLEVQDILLKIGLEEAAEYNHFLYIHELLNEKKVQPRDNGTSLIGIAIDLLEMTPKLLPLTTPSLTVHQLKTNTYYKIMHYYNLPVGDEDDKAILLGTTSEISVLSGQLFQNLQLDDLKTEASSILPKLEEAEIQVTNRQLYDLEDKELISCTGKIVMATKPMYYRACPNPECYRSPLIIQENDRYLCDDCQKTYFYSQTKGEACMDVDIMRDEDRIAHCKMYKNVIQIILNKMYPTVDPSVLPEALVDKKVNALLKPKYKYYVIISVKVQGMSGSAII